MPLSPRNKFWVGLVTVVAFILGLAAGSIISDALAALQF